MTLRIIFKDGAIADIDVDKIEKIIPKPKEMACPFDECPYLDDIDFPCVDCKAEHRRDYE